jgi:hypothetical protein
MANGLEEPRVGPAQGEWASILSAVTRPIALFGLALLVTEAALAIVALRSESSGQGILLIAVGVFVLVVLVVAVMGIWAPGALMGTEWLREPLAESIAESIVDGLQGGVTNLEDPEDQTTPFVDLILSIERRRQQEGVSEREFRSFLVRGVHVRIVRRMPNLKDGIETRLREGRDRDA